MSVTTLPPIVLVLGGGNALGAYHAGVYEALAQAGVEPEWVLGTSIGAITAAIIAGNAPGARVDRLRALWQPEDRAIGWPMPWDFLPETWRRSNAALRTLLMGRPGIFAPVGSGLLAMTDRSAATPALHDAHALRRTLERFVDFDLLNQGPVRFTAPAVDIETGEEVWFDTQDRTIGPDHVRASAALISAFPAIEVDGRLLGDGGLSVNLPLDPVMTAEGPTLCITSDLLPLAAARPRTLGEAISRTQDLTFAAQSRRTMERWRAVFAADPDRNRQSITLVNLAYSDQSREIAGKAMDFSPKTVAERWAAGHKDGSAAVARLQDGSMASGRPGLTIHRV